MKFTEPASNPRDTTRVWACKSHLRVLSLNLLVSKIGKIISHGIFMQTDEMIYVNVIYKVELIYNS